MTEEEKEKTLRWIRAWKNAVPELERMRCEDIRNADTRKFVKTVDGLVKATLNTHPTEGRRRKL